MGPPRPHDLQLLTMGEMLSHHCLLVDSTKYSAIQNKVMII